MNNPTIRLKYHPRFECGVFPLILPSNQGWPAGQEVEIQTKVKLIRARLLDGYPFPNLDKIWPNLVRLYAGVADPYPVIAAFKKYYAEKGMDVERTPFTVFIFETIIQKHDATDG